MNIIIFMPLMNIEEMREELCLQKASVLFVQIECII